MAVSNKVKISATAKELEEAFQKDMKDFKVHIFNIKQQYAAYKSLRENLSSSEALIHIDFSENFSCKLSEEIQSFHFGGSRQQATLHTGVIYVHQKSTPISFASVSNSLNHGPPAIWAHLKYPLSILKSEFPEFKTLHFFSDGPSTQYRQKNNFFLFCNLVFDYGFSCATWSYFEASHGKGASDGVGGALKRLANNFVAYGNDIPNAQILFDVLSKNSNVNVFFVEEEEVNEIFKVLPEKIKTLKGTRLIHQISTHKKGEIFYREISCYCKNNIWGKGHICSCWPTFPAKTLSFNEEQPNSKENEPNTSAKKKRTYYKDVYGSSSSEENEDNFSIHDSTDDENFDIQNLLVDDNDDAIDMIEPEVSKITQGTHILVQFLGGQRKATKFRYVGVCQSQIDDDGEVKVTFFKVISGNNGKIFRIDEEDTSYVIFNKILGILPNPKIILKGDRIFYEFPKPVDVFENS